MYFSLFNMKFKYGFGIGMYYKYVGGYYVVDIRGYYLCVKCMCISWNCKIFAVNMVSDGLKHLFQVSVLKFYLILHGVLNVNLVI